MLRQPARQGRRRVQPRQQTPRLRDVDRRDVCRHEQQPALRESIIVRKPTIPFQTPALSLRELLEVVGANEQPCDNIRRCREVSVLLVGFARGQQCRGNILSLVVQVAQHIIGARPGGIDLHGSLEVLASARQELGGLRRLARELMKEGVQPHGPSQLQARGVSGSPSERALCVTGRHIDPAGHVRTVARESGALVGDLPAEHDRIHPLAIGDLCQGAQGIGPLERGIAAGNVVARMERLCVLSRSFRLLQQGPRGGVARPQSLRSKLDLLTEALAQEVCHPARQAVSCQQEISRGLLEAGPLVVRTARAVDESH